MKTSQSICVKNRLTAFFVMRVVLGFRLISGCGSFRWARGFYRFLGGLSMNLQILCFFKGNFLAGGGGRALGGVSVFCAA